MINFIKKIFKAIFVFFGAVTAFGLLLAMCTNNTTNNTNTTAKTTTPKPTPKGWTASDTPGIYYRWCYDCKPPEYSIGSYVQLKIWCKEQACGDIYARVNFVDKEGTVVGWTNDTAYGGLGQKVVLTFDSAAKGTRRSAEITELNFRP